MPGGEENSGSTHYGEEVPQHEKCTSKDQEIDPANTASDEHSFTCNLDSLMK